MSPRTSSIPGSRAITRSATPQSTRVRRAWVFPVPMRPIRRVFVFTRASGLATRTYATGLDHTGVSNEMSVIGYVTAAVEALYLAVWETGEEFTHSMSPLRGSQNSTRYSDIHPSGSGELHRGTKAQGLLYWWQTLLFRAREKAK